MPRGRQRHAETQRGNKGRYRPTETRKEKDRGKGNQTQTDSDGGSDGCVELARAEMGN